MNILFFDTETNGMAIFHKPPEYEHQPHVIQLGAILTNDAQEEYARVALLTQPDIWNKIDPGAAKAHGITVEQCQQFGVPSITLFSLFEGLVEQADRICCHNAKFDLLLMQAMAHRLDRPKCFEGKDIFCTMEAYTPICKLPGSRGYKWPKLTEAYMHCFDEEFEGAHDALADISATKRIYFHLTEDQRK
jgi:DNA polymerase-3 subunit epsilon